LADYTDEELITIDLDYAWKAPERCPLPNVAPPAVRAWVAKVEAIRPPDAILLESRL
jgi:hypothetical protein